MRLYNVPQWGFCLGFPCEKCWHAKLSWKLTQKKQVKKRTTQYTHLPPLPEYSSPIGSTEGKQEGKYKKDQNWRFTSDIGREDITTPCLKIQYTVFSNFFFSFDLEPKKQTAPSRCSHAFHSLMALISWEQVDRNIYTITEAQFCSRALWDCWQNKPVQ